MSEPNTEDDDTTLRNVVLAFLNLIPKPTDDQTHALAGLLGFEFLDFEDRMREVLAPYIEEDEDPNKVNVKKIDIEHEHDLDDPLDTFLLAFYMLVPEPTEQQLLILSVLVNLTLSELEEHTYTVIHKLMEEHPQGDDTDFDDLTLDVDFENDDTVDHDADGTDVIDEALPDGDDDGDDADGETATIQLL